jgi:hypothetical protein
VGTTKFPAKAEYRYLRNSLEIVLEIEKNLCSILDLRRVAAYNLSLQKSPVFPIAVIGESGAGIELGLFC